MQIAATGRKGKSELTGNASSTAITHMGLVANVSLLLLGLYVVLKPYYLLPSGSPQIADIILLLTLALLPFLARAKQDAHTRGLVNCMAFFCLYAALVSFAWAIALMDHSVAVYATYYAFDFGLLIVCLRLGSLHPMATLRTIAYGVAASAIIQAGTSALASHQSQLRQTASFNNPNQLGYWSILCLCVFLVIAGRARIKWYLQATIITCLFYTVAISLSKAAMISAALMFVLHYLKNPKLIVLALLFTLVGYFAVENSTIMERVTGRLENIGQQQDDSLYSRGYLRIVEYPGHAILGAAEGAHYRFDNTTYSEERFEIHSTFGTILFSYGIPGLAAFSLAIWHLYRVSSFSYLLYLAPPFLYGLTHQGLRFSFLWLLISVIAILGQIRTHRPIAIHQRRPRQLMPQQSGRVS